MAISRTYSLVLAGNKSATWTRNADGTATITVAKSHEVSMEEIKFNLRQMLNGHDPIFTVMRETTVESRFLKPYKAMIYTARAKTADDE